MVRLKDIEWIKRGKIKTYWIAYCGGIIIGKITFFDLSLLDSPYVAVDYANDELSFETQQDAMAWIEDKFFHLVDNVIENLIIEKDEDSDNTCS